MRGLDRHRGPGGVGVREAPEARYVGEIQPIAGDQDAGSGPIDGVAESLRQDFRMVGPAVTVPVADAAQHFAFTGEEREIGGERIGQERPTVGHAAERHVGQQPVRLLGDVENADGPPVGFGQVDPSAPIEGEGHAVAELRLGGPDIEFESRAQLKAFGPLRGLRPSRG